MSLNTQSLQPLINFIYSVADQILINTYEPSKYKDVILPMTVIRRLDAVLEPTKDKVLETHEKYKDKLVIIGFPANNFGQQEPGTNGDIKEFCMKNYGVTFPMAEKVDVVGENIHPLFKYLSEEAKKLGTPDPIIKWNFTKFLVDENGKLVAVFPSKVTPMSEEITKYLN